MPKDSICLNTPSKLNYISLIRLTASSIAHNSKLNIDEIEDIKVCVSEASINVLNFTKSDEIAIKFDVYEDKLVIRIKDVSEKISNEENNYEEGELGLLIIKSLMDHVKFSHDGIEMVKYI